MGIVDGFFGDGGKGNVASLLLEEAVLRVQKSSPEEGKPIYTYSGVGANNAANSYCINGEQYVLRQTPAG